MGWFSDLLNRKPYGPDIAFNCNVPMPKVKAYNEDQSGVILPKGALYVTPKDISEPVYAIVKAMKERPSSFKVKFDNQTSENVNYEVLVFDVIDVRTKQKVRATRHYGYKDYTYEISWSWLTPDEHEFLGKAAQEMYNKKIERVNRIKRAAMKAIYQ